MKHYWQQLVGHKPTNTFFRPIRYYSGFSIAFSRSTWLRNFQFSFINSHGRQRCTSSESVLYHSKCFISLCCFTLITTPNIWLNYVCFRNNMEYYWSNIAVEISKTIKLTIHDNMKQKVWEQNSATETTNKTSLLISLQKLFCKENAIDAKHLYMMRNQQIIMIAISTHLIIY